MKKKKKLKYKNVFELKNLDGKKFLMTKKLWWKEQHLMWTKVGNEDKKMGKEKTSHYNKTQNPNCEKKLKISNCNKTKKKCYKLK